MLVVRLMLLLGVGGAYLLELFEDLFKCAISGVIVGVVLISVLLTWLLLVAPLLLLLLALVVIGR